MKSTCKLTKRLLEHMREDLHRPHPFAHERVGFVTCRFALTLTGELLVLAYDYHPVADDDYIENRRFGALIGSAAFRKAMQLAYGQDVGVFHIHMHCHRGTPTPSSIDLRETRRFVPDFFHVRPKLPHGALILSLDAISGRIWYPTARRARQIDQFIVVGAPLVTCEA